MSKSKKITLIAIIAAAVVLTGVMVLLLLLPKGGDSDSSAATPDEAADISLSTDANGVHQAVIGKTGGSKNGYGTLMEYVPADIKTIHVENENGTLDITANTPEGEATVYTLVGFEDFEIRSGVPDQIANAAATLSFTRIAGEDNGGSEFGFDKPRSVAEIAFTDDTKEVITVGADAPQSKGTYIKFGDGKEIYVIDTETANNFLLGVNDMISLTINDTADSTDNSGAQTINVTSNGASFILERYTGVKFSSTYYLTEPMTRFASESESSKIEGGIRGLYADTVKYVNPSDSQLSDAGLSQPYATLNADYPDTSVSLSASKPDSDGNVNLMLSGRSIVYTIKAEKVPWVETTYEKLCSEYVLYPKMTALTGFEVNGKAFRLSTRESHTTDDEGNESTSYVTTVFLGGEEIQIENFSGFCSDVGMIELADPNEGSTSGEATLTIKYTYEDGDSDDVAFYPDTDTLYTAVVNGKVMGHARKSDITRTLEGLEKFN